LDDLLERLLAVVRLDKLTIKRTPLRRWLEDCVNRLRHEDAWARLEVNGPDTEWPMDEYQMARALDNLLANALRHTPVDGLVRISAEQRGDSCYVVVEDTGPGVLLDSREKIFEPFASFRSNGTGLG
jgi:two-component system, NtrC family, sensor histidine kinase KinB